MDALRENIARINKEAELIEKSNRLLLSNPKQPHDAIQLHKSLLDNRVKLASSGLTDYEYLIDFYNKYLRKRKFFWKKHREQIIELHGSKCDICGVSKQWLTVHHNTPMIELFKKCIEGDDYSIYNYVYDYHFNVSVICSGCHKKEHSINPGNVIGSYHTIGGIK
jgi:hypothetical protein